jgi:hypothetical protein
MPLATHRSSNRRRPAALLLAAVAGCAGPLIPAVAVGQAAVPDADQLRQRVAELEARLARVEAEQTARPAVHGAGEVRLASQAVAADAATRPGAPVVSYDPMKGLNISSADGSFSLRPGFQLQFRGVLNSSQEAGGRETDQGFELRRMYFRFDGNVISKDLTYNLMWESERNGGAVKLYDAAFTWRFAPDWALKFGQYEATWTHEAALDPFYIVATEASLADKLVGAAITDREQGVGLIYGGKGDNPFKAEFAFTDGGNTRNTNFTNGDANFGGWTRLEWKAFGAWEDYGDLSAAREKQDLLVLGVGADYTDRAGGDALLTSADANYKNTHGLSLYGSVHTNFTQTRGASTADGTVHDLGASAQVTQALGKQWDVFARGSWVELDENASYQEYTVGCAYYLGKDGSLANRAKVQFDISYLPQGAPEGIMSLDEVAGDDAQFVARVQLQLHI